MELPGTKKIIGYELLERNVEIGIFQNSIGSYAVVMRQGGATKGMLCLSFEQASDVYTSCVEKISTKFIVLN